MLEDDKTSSVKSSKWLFFFLTDGTRAVEQNTVYDHNRFVLL